MKIESFAYVRGYLRSAVPRWGRRAFAAQAGSVGIGARFGIAVVALSVAYAKNYDAALYLGALLFAITTAVNEVCVNSYREMWIRDKPKRKCEDDIDQAFDQVLRSSRRAES